MHQAVGEYEELPGWDEDLGDCRDEADLPPPRATTSPTSPSFIGVPVALIGVGPGRDQVIWTEAGKRTACAQRAAIV